MTNYRTGNSNPLLQEMRYINTDLDIDAIRDDLAKATQIKTVSIDGKVWNVPIVEGLVSIDEFLNDEQRCVVEQRVYTHGDDLEEVYKTQRTPFGDDEINILHADQQIPHVGALREELDLFLSYVHPGELTKHDVEIRELTAKKDGHSRHRDHRHGYTMKRDQGARYPLVTTSVSLPLGSGLDNSGLAPPFIMEEIDAEGGVVYHAQDKPGSLVLFGPKLYHTHPPTTMMSEPFLWLVSQPFFRVGDQNEK